MAEKSTAQEQTSREIRPNKKHPFEFNIGKRRFLGPTIIAIGQDKDKKDITKTVPSKSSVIPAVMVAMLFHDETPEAIKKIESKLIPLKSGK